MKKALVALFVFLVATPAMADGKTVLYQVNGEAYEGYYVTPGRNAPLILLIHDWDGLTGYEIKRAGMLADAGYAVFAADLFGAGVRPTQEKEKRRLTGELYEDRGKMRRLLQGALKAASDQGAHTDRAVAMGYCFGGAAVLELARSGAGLKGYVTFHGGLGTPPGQDYTRTSGKLLIFHGTADAHVPMSDFCALAVELEREGVPHEMVTYGGAPHAFTVFGSSRYRADADRESWARFMRFLGETFKPE